MSSTFKLEVLLLIEYQKTIGMNKKILALAFAFSSTFSLFAQNEKNPEATEFYEPVPKKVTPGKSFGDAPSDAIILFDGSGLSEWQNPQFKGEAGDIEGIEKMLSGWDDSFNYQPAGWVVKGGELIVKSGNGAIETKKRFNNFQLHIEWLAPKAEGKKGQGYSNSGIFLMGLYEIQVLNSYDNETYVNGQAGSIYKQFVPLVNASRPTDTWQSYDVVFYGPNFDESGKLVSPAHVTVFHNGVLVQSDVELKGPTAYIGQTKYIPQPSKMPLRLQDHGNPVRYRNIWIREL
jgi:3-keto-disaccharide hydrolase